MATERGRNQTIGTARFGAGGAPSLIDATGAGFGDGAGAVVLDTPADIGAVVRTRLG